MKCLTEPTSNRVSFIIFVRNSVYLFVFRMRMGTSEAYESSGIVVIFVNFDLSSDLSNKSWSNHRTLNVVRQIGPVVQLLV